jgi:hypothetical protein
MQVDRETSVSVSVGVSNSGATAKLSHVDESTEGGEYGVVDVDPSSFTLAPMAIAVLELGTCDY